jgi:pimeloyl-ACP methyl ester carboxylesterase
MQRQSGFTQQSISTSLGKMIYATEEPSFWGDKVEAQKDNDRPTLVFLHGFGGGSSAYEWSKVYPAFANEYHILAPDLIGWGQSDHLTRHYTINDYLETITEFLEKTCSSATTVIASSLTAALVVRIAVAHPELFRSLILVAPAGLADFEVNYANSWFAQLASTPILDRLIYTTGVSNEIAIRTFLEQQQFYNSEKVYPEIITAYLDSAQKPKAEYSALSFVRGDLSFDLSQYIEHLTVPTAILWGQHARFTGPEIGQQLVKLNPLAIQYFQVLDDVGLTPQLERPEITIGLLQKYLRLLKSSS